MGTCIVVGGGPAGMMAAVQAAESGGRVILLEKNEKLGKKLYITGKGRCNLTNASDIDGLQAHTNANPRFMYSAYSAFGSAAVMAFFENKGVGLTVERGRRVFPASGRASDITRALEGVLREKGVAIHYHQQVTNMIIKDGAVRAVQTRRTRFNADAAIIAAGGLSYPSTGSDGEGYALARQAGHTLAPTYPSLVPLLTEETWTGGLAGLSLKNIRCMVRFPGAKKPAYDEIGELMFTPGGVTGPLILSASRYVTHRLAEKPCVLLDLKPGLTPAQLDARLLRDFAENANRDFANSLRGLLPERLAAAVAALSGIPPEKKVCAITRLERQRLGALLKGLPLTPARTGGYDEAVVTMGGVDVREINPSTLMSKKVKGLFFAGEVLDVDAMTGGYNLQIAFSTGYLAGKSAGEYVGRG